MRVSSYYAVFQTALKGNTVMADITDLQKILGVTFRDTSLLEKSLVHRSYLNENQGIATDSNERLEFLGDAVLGLVVAGKLYRDYPNFNEGEMTRFRSTLVRRETLARVAESINLGDYLFLGKGEALSGGRRKAANLACVLEAVIAAVYIDRGYRVTEKLILKLLEEELAKAMSIPATTDYKSRLQELIQSKEQRAPVYHLIGSTGPDHIKTFNVEVLLGDTVLGSGSGKSKKEAETEAARKALDKLL
jgi:ribonuclease III